jgi:hypothetical protein
MQRSNFVSRKFRAAAKHQKEAFKLRQSKRMASKEGEDGDTLTVEDFSKGLIYTNGGVGQQSTQQALNQKELIESAREQ